MIMGGMSMRVMTTASIITRTTTSWRGHQIPKRSSVRAASSSSETAVF